MAFKNIERQLEIIKRATVDCLPENEFLKKLKRSKNRNLPLNIKMGFDPTAPDIHLGHTVGIRKLRQFQDLGHHVTVIIGDYTATVGDPTDKETTRPRLSHKEALKNAESYKNQILKILIPNLTRFRYNGEWFKNISFNDIMLLASQTTVAQMLERNDFSNRYKKGQAISLHEFFYPLMQAYDSLMINADIEMGATEQKFNLMMGRQIQEAHEKEKQCILTLPVLEGIDGVHRMSKSLGNYIGIDESADEIFGKILSIPDTLIYRYYELVTDVSLNELPSLKSFSEADPRNAKRALAKRLVTMYHSSELADKAEAKFDKIFIKKEIPSDIPQMEFTEKNIPILDLILSASFAKSRGEARRLIRGNAVSYNNEKINDENTIVKLSHSAILKVGKKNFLKIKIV